MANKNIFPDSGENYPDTDLSNRFNLPVINQEMLYNIFMQVPAILCILNGPDLIYEFANGYYKKMVGKTNIIGKKMGDILPGLHEKGYLDALKEVYATNKSVYVRQVKIAFPRENSEPEIFFLDVNCQVYYGHDEPNKKILIFAYDVSEQVQTRRLIARAEKRFRGLFYNIPVPLYTCDKNGRIILFNNALVDFCGKEPDLENDFWCPINNMYRRDGSLIPKERWQSFNKKQVYNNRGIELIFELYDGTRKNIMMYPELILDENGEIEGIINCIIDVTEQENARKEMEDVAKVVENLYRDAPAFICTLRGPDHVYELVNPAFQDMMGNKNLSGKRLFEAHPELKEQGIYKLINHVYKTGNPFVGTEQVIFHAKKLNEKLQATYANFSLQPIYDSDKKISGLMIFGYDVTELVYTRQKSEENLKKILESLPQITSISSPDGTNIYFNHFFYTYSGLSEEEAAVNGWNSILHPEEIESILMDWEDSKSKKEEFYRELRLKREGDGMYRWHIVTLTPVMNVRGEVLQWVASATDIHEQKWKEEKKDEFLSIASHELKTPLTSVKAYLQLIELSLENTESDVKLYTQKAIVSVDRLGSLISELLDVSKIQQQSLNLNINTYNFDDMLNRIIETLEFNTTHHKIIKTGEIIKDIRADKERMEQVINNVLSNAMKYTPEGGNIIIDVSQERGNLKVSVTDTGIGISSHNLGNIFERYFRAEGHDIHFQGLGIGLFISMEIIKMHGGQMWVKSELDQGSTFSFLIPLKENNKR